MLLTRNRPMSNLAAMLRLPANLKSTQWQILAGPILKVNNRSSMNAGSGSTII
ncbi:hypothetical protein ACUOFC_03070, partial [Escherichia sp. TWPC-MK]